MVTKKKDLKVHASGRRKRSIARATLTVGKGVVRINNQLLSKFSNSLARARIEEPLILGKEVTEKFNINVNVSGGGVQGQADAVRLAIGKALVMHDKKLKGVFLAYDRSLVVADVRAKEKCKPGDSKARAKRQKSYR